MKISQRQKQQQRIDIPRGPGCIDSSGHTKSTQFYNETHHRQGDTVNLAARASDKLIQPLVRGWGTVTIFTPLSLTRWHILVKFIHLVVVCEDSSHWWHWLHNWNNTRVVWHPPAVQWTSWYIYSLAAGCTFPCLFHEAARNVKWTWKIHVTHHIFCDLSTGGLYFVVEVHSSSCGELAQSHLVKSQQHVHLLRYGDGDYWELIEYWLAEVVRDDNDATASLSIDVSICVTFLFKANIWRHTTSIWLPAATDWLYLTSLYHQFVGSRWGV